MKVWWQLSSAADRHLVEFGETEKLGRRVESLESTRTPLVTLHGLVPGRRYFYRVGTADIHGEIHSFVYPGSGKSLRIGIWADNQTGCQKFFEESLPMLTELKPDLLVSAGDLVGRGEHEGEWATQLYGPARKILRSVAWIPARGNHDGESPVAYRMLPRSNERAEGWSAASIRGVRIVTLNSNLNADPPSGSSQAAEAQLDWLKRETESSAWKRAELRLVILHHPPFTNHWHKEGYDGEPFVRKVLLPRLLAASVDVLIAGHAHLYQHYQLDNASGPMHVFTLGGGGGELDRVQTKDWPNLKTALTVHHIALLELSSSGVELSVFSRKNRAVDASTLSLIDRVLIQGHGQGRIHEAGL